MSPTVYVNGVALDLDGVEYRITVSHGRNDITAAPQPSDASMTLLGFLSVPVDISDLVEVVASVAELAAAGFAAARSTP